MPATTTINTVTATGIDMGKNILHTQCDRTRPSPAARRPRANPGQSWYASSLILPVTGGSSMRELNP